MMIDFSSALVLASLILTSTQGADLLKTQLPLHAVDQGENWLVKGTPSVDRTLNLRYCIYSVFINKKSAQVLAIDFSGRPQLTAAEEKHWHTMMAPDEFDRIFGPPTVFKPDGRYLDLNGALYGGVVNRPEDAVAYAHILMRLAPSLALIPGEALSAQEHAGVWHISATVPGHSTPKEVLSFSRYDGKVVSGQL